MTILALHGFLGKSSDWIELKNLCATAGLKAEWVCPDFFDPKKGLDFRNREFIFEQLEDLIHAKAKPWVLLGYSFGGRMALSLQNRKPKEWQKSAYFATHLGLDSLSEAEARQISDAKWSYKFLKEDWKICVQEWNKQAVFKQDTQPLRREAEFDKNRLANSMRLFSLGRQDLIGKFSDTGAMGAQAGKFFVGKLDQKYMDLYAGWKKSGRISDFIQVPERAHRLLQGPHPDLVRQLVQYLNL